jgi:hypothetical protein
MCHGKDLGAANDRAVKLKGFVTYEVLDGKKLFDEDVRIVFYSIPGAHAAQVLEQQGR